MPPSTKSSAPTLGVDKKNVFIRKILHALQDSDLSIYGLGDMGYAKVQEKIYIWTYEGPRKRKK
jgi:hypothetical protein